MDNWNRGAVLALLLRASRLAYRNKTNLQVLHKEEGNHKEIFTNVDILIENMLIKELERPSRGHFVLGEETAQEKVNSPTFLSNLEQTMWIIDPIDGTQNFVLGLPMWGISIGYLKGGKFCEGAIALPDLGQVYITDKDRVYVYNSRKKLAFTRYVKPSLLAPLVPQSTTKIISISTEISRMVTKRHTPLHVNGSCSFSLCQTLSSSYAAYIGRAKIWDFAGAIALFKAIGSPLFYYDMRRKSLQNFPDTISTKIWKKNYTSLIHPLVFSNSQRNARQLLAELFA